MRSWMLLVLLGAGYNCLSASQKCAGARLMHILQSTTLLSAPLLSLIISYVGPYSLHKVVKTCQEQPTCLSLSPNSKHIVVADEGTEACILDAETGSVSCLLRGHERSINEAHFSKNSDRIITGSDDDTVKIWDVKTGKAIHTFTHGSPVASVHINCDGRFAASASDTYTYIWSISTGYRKSCLTDLIPLVRFSPVEASHLAVIGQDHRAWLQNIHSLELKKIHSRLSGVKILDFNHKGQEIGMTTQDQKVHTLNINFLKYISQQQYYSIHSLLFSPDDRYLALAIANGTVRLVEPNEMKDKCTLFNPGDPAVYSMAWYPHRSQLVTASSDKKICRWDMYWE